MTRRVGFGVLLVVGSILALALVWFDGLAPHPAPAPTSRTDLPSLPAWRAADAGTPQALPAAPADAEIKAFVAGARSRFEATLPDRWRLALVEGRLLGPVGALALARGSGLPVGDPARQAVLASVAAEVIARARNNDFTGAEALLEALLAEEREATAIVAARARLADRRARWQQDPARAARITEYAEQARDGIAHGHPAALAAALAAVAHMAKEDPEHLEVTALRAAITRRALAAWRSALEAGDWSALGVWSAWASLHLPEDERRELAAATRAALDRKAAPAGASPAGP